VLLSASQSWARAGLTANVGLAAEPEVDARNLRNADRGIIGLGGHILLGQTRSPDDAGAQTGISLEVRGELPWEAAAIAGTGAPWEAVASARHARSNGGFFTVGAATALTGGAGAAAFRVVLGGGFGAPLGPATQVAEILPPPPAPPPLAVRVLRDGAPVEGARIEAGGFTSTSQLTPVMIELPGGGRVEAAYGPCLAGVSDVDSSARTADVALLPVRPATLAVEVRDPSGATVPGASVELYADDSGCSPTPVWLDESASAMARVGATTWHVRASAPGHQPYAGDVIARADQVSVVNAVLVPNAPLGKVRVVERGIELLEQVHFDTGKATLRPGSELVLADVVRALAATEARGHVEVQGHTDDVGNDASNLALSQARAEAVVAWLVANGVAPARLTARGYGETRPLGPNDAAEGRQRNRRVEFVFQVAP
jgi:outer membrane protein OmpA-like peptidoglycan-associated protein